MKLDQLIELAREYQERSHAVVTNRRVGSIVLAEDGRHFGGSNFEISHSP